MVLFRKKTRKNRTVPVFINNSGAWIIYGPRLLQRQGSGPRSCSELPQVGYNEADVVRLARL